MNAIKTTMVVTSDVMSILCLDMLHPSTLLDSVVAPQDRSGRGISVAIVGKLAPKYLVAPLGASALLARREPENVMACSAMAGAIPNNLPSTPKSQRGRGWARRSGARAHVR